LLESGKREWLSLKAGGEEGMREGRRGAGLGERGLGLILGVSM